MTADHSDDLLNTLFFDHLSLKMVMDHARVNPAFMAQLISKLQERGVDDRSDEENSLLEWARSTKQVESR